MRSGSLCSSCMPIRFLLRSRSVVFQASRRVMLSNSAIASVNCSASPASKASAKSCHRARLGHARSCLKHCQLSRYKPRKRAKAGWWVGRQDPLTGYMLGDGACLEHFPLPRP